MSLHRFVSARRRTACARPRDTPPAHHAGWLFALLTPIAMLVAFPARAEHAETPTLTIRHVATTGSDSGDCATEANPCATISYAINQSSDGDTIEIAAGEYTESFEIDKSLSLHGAGEASTIIQAHEQPGAADSRVILIDGNYVVNIADVTIRHGIANDMTFPNSTGGGLLCSGGTLSMTNVTVVNNASAGDGGGMANLGGSRTLTNVTFLANYSGLAGGGVYNQASSPTLTNVVFDGNVAANWGGAMANFQGSSPMLNGVLFSANEATDGLGGAMYNDASSPTLIDVTFRGNKADYGGGIASFSGSSPTLVNVVFSGNDATGFFGGGMYNQESSPSLTNVSFSGNRAGQGGGGLFNYSGSSPTLTNVIFWNNQQGDSTTTTSASVLNFDGASDPVISYSLIANSGGSDGWAAAIGIDGGNNLDADPLLVDTPDPSQAPTSAGNLRLQAFSPAIDRGDPETDLSLFHGGPDSPVDRDGNPRVVCYSIDLGAYESTAGGTANCDVLFRNGFDR